MKFRFYALFLLYSFSCFAGNVHATNSYELRKLTEDEWLAMSTEERLNALGMSKKHTRNQTFIGNFGRHHDLYKKWGYDFYEMEDRYENYSFRGFENYNIIENRRRKWSYNEFGDRIAKMQMTANIWHETYEGDGTFYVETPNGFINAMGTMDIDGVWVAKEATDDWAFSVIGARSIRSKFTPLTLSLPNMHGMRLDLQTAQTDATILTSSLLGTWWSSAVNRWYGGRGSTGTGAKNTQLVKKGGVMLRGGNFRRKFGVLTVGATYVNQYGVQGNREGGDSWGGTVSNYTPTPLVIAVRILDDSPQDRDRGPIVYDVKLKVNGKYRYDIYPDILRDDISLDRTTALIREADLAYLTPSGSAKIGKPKYDFLGIEGSLPKYSDYFFWRDYKSGANPKKVVDGLDIGLINKYFTMIEPGGGPVEVNGTECVVYFFDLMSVKEHINRVEAEMTVANDYNIQTSYIYTKDNSGGHDTVSKNTTYYDAMYWKTMAQAEGNVKDKSNVTTLNIDIGTQVACSVIGMDFDLNYMGFKVTGEFTKNTNRFMYPDGLSGTGFPEDIISGQAPRTGHKYLQKDNAYYITAQKDWDTFGFVAEKFKMGKFYHPYMDYFYAIAGDQGYGPGAINSRNNTIRFPLVEDNDDNDQYPDTMIEQNAVGWKIISSEDPDGVFPGNDADNDGLADNNKNNNGIPDYDEPFLMFDVDHDDFVFGNDYNNNNIPDFREDDMKFDLPYELDRQGHHIMVRYTPFQKVNLIAGSFRTGNIGRNNRTNDDYVKLLVNYYMFGIAKLYAEYRYERIKDNIRDQYIQVSDKMSEDYLNPGIGATLRRFDRNLFYDELEYKNSRVNRLWVNSAIRAIPSITLENHLKLEVNDQIEGVMYDNTYQPGETINTIALVNKIVYSKTYGNVTFSPGFKFRFYKKDRSDLPRPGDYYTTRIPLIMVVYKVTEKSKISLGMQGIPYFEYIHKDFVQNENDQRQKIYCFQIENYTTYFGYNIWASAGIKLDELEYDNSIRTFENYKSSTTFVKVVLGW
ncbi:hypothetical protein ACFL60_06160 [Candidatus Omnitrophota bacterium]